MTTPDSSYDWRSFGEHVSCPFGFIHIEVAEAQTAEGKLYLFVGIGRISKFAVTQLVDKRIDGQLGGFSHCPRSGSYCHADRLTPISLQARRSEKL